MTSQMGLMSQMSPMGLMGLMGLWYAQQRPFLSSFGFLLVADSYFFGVCVYFLVDCLSLLSEQEEAYPLLPMSFARDFFNTLVSSAK